MLLRGSGSVDDNQKRLLIKYLKQYYPNSYKQMLMNYPLTGPDGLRRKLGEKSIEYFAKAYLADQFKMEFGDYASEIFLTLKCCIESKAPEKQAVVAPRGHGKSTISSFAIPTWAACYKKKDFILFISANGDTSANFLAKTQKAIESLEIVEDFGVLRGKVWNADEVNLKNGVWVACTGWKSGLRGINKDSRPDLIILDDLEDKATMESDSLRKKLESAFRDEIGKLGLHKTDFFYIGTLLSDDSLLANVIKEPSWKVLFYKCVKSFPEREDLWDKWREIYRDILNPNRFEDAYKFYLDNKDEMDIGVEVLWPGRFPDGELRYKGAYYNIMLARETWGEDSFWKEDQNEPRSGLDRVFKQMYYWSEFPEGVSLKLAVDPSEGKGDFSSFAIGGAVNAGYVVREGHIAKLDPTGIIDFICSKVKEYPGITEIIVEENLFRGMLQKQLVEKLRQLKLYRPVVAIRNTKNKHARILQIEPLVNGGSVLFNKASVAFNKQIEDYKLKCKNDDAPDALEILISRLRKNKLKARQKPVGW